MGIDRMLKGHDVFRSLDVKDVSQISAFSSVRKYEAMDSVFKHGADGSHVYMLLEGGVNLRLPTSPADISLIISKIAKGELFGLSPLLDSPKYTATAQCSEYTEVLAIEAQPFRDLLKANCPAGFDVMNKVAHIYFNRYINVLKSLQGVVSQISLIR